jgi:hypothetical protein
MGCTSSYTREEFDLVQLPLDSRIQYVGIFSLDEDFTKAKALITNLEEIRNLMIDNRDQLVLKSGACAYNCIDMKAIINSFLIVMSVYLEHDLCSTKRVICNNYPYLSIECDENKKANKLYKCFMSYLSDLKSAKYKLETFSEGFIEFQAYLSTNLNNYISKVNEVFSFDSAKM